jgi:hypothetical protein
MRQQQAFSPASLSPSNSAPASTPGTAVDSAENSESSASRGVAMVSLGVAIQFFKIFQHFKWLNQSFKGPI